MAPKRYYPYGSNPNVYIAKNGTVRFPQTTIEELGWQPGETIVGINYIEDETSNYCILFDQPLEHDGYKLHPHNRGSEDTGSAYISTTGFINKYLRARVALPFEAAPIYLEDDIYQLALLFENDRWLTEEFSVAGVESVSPRAIGVYQCLHSTGRIVYVGRGNIRNRINRHLKRDDFLKQTQTFRYITLSDADDAPRLEHVYMQWYKQNNDGDLPPLNKNNA